jgi:hypothetical protein
MKKEDPASKVSSFLYLFSLSRLIPNIGPLEPGHSHVLQKLPGMHGVMVGDAQQHVAKLTLITYVASVDHPSAQLFRRERANVVEKGLKLGADSDISSSTETIGNCSNGAGSLVSFEREPLLRMI